MCVHVGDMDKTMNLPIFSVNTLQRIWYAGKVVQKLLYHVQNVGPPMGGPNGWPYMTMKGFKVVSLRIM